MKYKPLKVQEEAYRFLLKNKQAGLFVKMGVGKTVVVLTLIEKLMYDYASIGRALIIAPLRVSKLTWPDEIAKWKHTHKLSHIVVHGPKKKELAEASRDYDVTIINYDGLNWYINNHRRFGKYDLVVFDESTFVKNPKSNRTQIATSLSRWISRRIILTGTPTPNGMEDVWSQIFLLDRGVRLGGDIKDFYQRYFIPDSNPYRHKKYFIKKGSRKQIVNAIADKVMVVEDTTGLGLPAVVDNLIPVELNAKGRKHYDEVKKDFFTVLDRTTDLSILNQQAQTQKLRQILSGFVYIKQDDLTNTVVEIHNEKLKALKELYLSLSGRNLFVAIQFKEDAVRIQKYFKKEFKNGIPTINSDTTEKKSLEYIRQWNKGKLGMLLAHPASVSHGLNMQVGGYDIIWYNQTWLADEYDQFIARLARRGQKNRTVFNHIMLVRDTIDEVIYEAVSAKNATQQRVLEQLKEWRDKR